MLSHNSDASHTAYHQLHQKTAKTSAREIASVNQAIATGDFAEHGLLLAYNASIFTACRPANPELTRLGFYDEPNKVCITLPYTTRRDCRETASRYHSGTCTPWKSDRCDDGCPRYIYFHFHLTPIFNGFDRTVFGVCFRWPLVLSETAGTRSPRQRNRREPTQATATDFHGAGTHLEVSEARHKHVQAVGSEGSCQQTCGTRSTDC